MTGAMISLVAAAYGHDGCRSSSRCRDAAEQPNEELFWWPSVTPSKSEGAAAVDETVATCAPPGCAGCRGTARPAGPGRSCACSQWRGHTPRFDLDIHAPQGLGKAVCGGSLYLDPVGSALRDAPEQPYGGRQRPEPHRRRP